MSMNSRRELRRARARTRAWRWVIGGVCFVIIGAALWIGIRGLIARDALLGAMPLVHSLREDVASGEVADLDGTLEEVAARAETAAALTSDPVWRAAEVIPWVGANLSSFRQASAVVDEVARDALPPLAALAGELDLSAFAPRDGAIDLAPLVTLGPPLAEASAVLASAADSAARIPTAGTVPQIGEAVEQLVDLIEETNSMVTAVSSAVELLPGMLGADEPRDYLLLVQNNAELRAAGGIPGALAIIHAESGRIRLGQQATAADFGKLPQPAMPPTPMEERLYGGNFAIFMQNVTTTPDFARTGELARAMWRDRFGLEVDGVLSVDPVALALVLRATGPVELADGVVLDADNAVDVLLSGVYHWYEEPRQQDAFFAAAAAAVFNRVAAGGDDPQGLVGALIDAALQRRVLVWSAHEDDQEILKRGNLVAGPPASDDDRTGIGVYFNDNTEAKMDYYLRGAIATGAVECRNDDRPFYEVRIQLQSTAPEDAATSLPDYVTGARNRALGIVKGQIQTTTYVHAPAGSQIYDVRMDGQSAVWISGEDEGSVVAGVTSVLDPGESVVLTFHLLGPADAPTAVRLDHTPTAHETPTSIDNMIACPTLPGPPTA